MLLDDDDVDAIARRVAELVRPAPMPAPVLLSVTEVCARFGLTRSWVYAHARELGAIRLGPRPRARLRFDVARCAEYFTPPAGPEAAAALPAPVRPLRPRAPLLPPGVELIEGRLARR